MNLVREERLGYRRKMILHLHQTLISEICVLDINEESLKLTEAFGLPLSGIGGVKPKEA